MMTTKEVVVWGALRSEIPKDRVRNVLGGLKLIRYLLIHSK